MSTSLSERSSAAPASVGTFTFLFTDLVGSTRLWEQHPEPMRAALARHDHLLREAVEAVGGRVFKTTGDGAAAVFTDAASALSSAIRAQQALLSEPWPEVTKLAARMALHTGEAEQREGDYYGPTLNRVARLLATGHGGQILLSQAAYEFCRFDLPGSVSLLELGAHRLKDLARPETVWQIQHPDLPNDFPPLRSLGSPYLPNNLPQQLTSFIGRERELMEIKRLLTAATNTARLLTLTGPGGTGKTRLSLQVAADLIDPDRFPDGVWFVELAPLTDPALLPTVIAQTLRIAEQPGKPVLNVLSEHLKEKRLLLILDNCEHLIDAAARLADTVLRTASGVTLLATSREPLNVVGERRFNVPSLGLPRLKKSAAVVSDVSLEALNRSEAARLFIDRATAVRADFAVTHSNAAAVVDLCRRLDGIPLALELAAARVRSLSVEDIDNRLDDRFRLLTGGSRTALPRQQTLRALIDWSWDLLTAPEQTVLARLSVFAGGWTLEAAESVCGFDSVEDWEVLDLLTGLVDKSLVLTDEQWDGSLRYHLLETVRAYAADRLRQSGEEETAATRERHRDWFLTLARGAEAGLVGGEEATWLSRLDTESDNLRAALDNTVAMSADQKAAPTGLEFVAYLWHYWYQRGQFTEGRERTRVMLAAATAEATDREAQMTRAEALRVAGIFAAAQGDYAAARPFYNQALALCRTSDDEKGVGRVLSGLGNLELHQGNLEVARNYFTECLTLNRKQGRVSAIASAVNCLGIIASIQGDFQTAQDFYKESITLQEELGNRGGVAGALCNLGIATLALEEYDEARRIYTRALGYFRELGMPQGAAAILCNLGRAAMYQGELDEATEFYNEGLALRREMGDRQGIANALCGLGIIATKRGDLTAAEPLLREALDSFYQIGDRREMAEALEAWGMYSRARSEHERCVVIYGTAATVREQIDAPFTVREQRDADQDLDAARAGLGQEAFAAAWERGRSLTDTEIVAFILGR